MQLWESTKLYLKNFKKFKKELNHTGNEQPPDNICLIFASERSTKFISAQTPIVIKERDRGDYMRKIQTRMFDLRCRIIKVQASLSSENLEILPKIVSVYSPV